MAGLGVFVAVFIGREHSSLNPFAKISLAAVHCMPIRLLDNRDFSDHRPFVDSKKNETLKIEAIPSQLLDQLFPGGFTVRDEANALTALAFRNGPLEDLHAGGFSPLTNDASLSRITQEEMKELMIDASTKLARLLSMRETEPEKYNSLVQVYGASYCVGWDRK